MFDSTNYNTFNDDFLQISRNALERDLPGITYNPETWGTQEEVQEDAKTRLDFLNEVQQYDGLSTQQSTLMPDYEGEFNRWMQQQSQVEPEQGEPQVTSVQAPSVSSTNYHNSTKQQKRQAYIQFFITKGLTREQAAGIVGNLEQESGLKHNAVGDNGQSYGLAQFHKERRDALFTKYGNNPTDIQQLEFIWEELNSTESEALRALRAARTIEAATDAICDRYERPSAQYANKRKRIDYARRAYDNQA